MDRLDRRTLITGMTISGLAAAGTAGAAVLHTRFVRSRPAGEYEPALAALEAYVSGEMQARGLPGLTLCVADADGFTATLTFGEADTENHVPIRPDHLFQIGSISKSFAAVALLTLVDEGKLDLEAPLASYMHELALPAEPMTIAQVLTHSAGLPGGAPLFPRTPDGRLWCGFEPGSDFSYSNTGYALLGQLLARLSGTSCPEAIHHRVLAPLGMKASIAAITGADRDRSAIGYRPLRDDRPYLPGQPLAQGPWTNLDDASGAILSTPDDMAIYLRFLLAAGRGDGGSILSPGSARRLVAPLVDAEEFGPKARYGFGIATVQVGDTPCLHHTGGMLLFSSSFHADPKAGVACFASTNADTNGYRPSRITAYAIELMRHARGVGAPPKAPNPLKPITIERPAGFAGRFFAADGTVIELALRADALALIAGGRSGRLLKDGDSLITDHPTYQTASFSPITQGDAVTGLWWRDTLFTRDKPAPQPVVPDRLRKLAGHYESTDPWVGDCTVYARGATLTLSEGAELTERDGYWARRKDKGGTERYRFDAPIDGRPSRLNISGVDLLRVSFA